MIDWLKKNEWMQESGGGFSEVVSFLAFVAMPGCIFGAIIHRFLQSIDWPR